MAAGTADGIAERAGPKTGTPITSRVGVFWPTLATFVMAFAVLVARRFDDGDYVGADNDDVMRLVQVRDLLAGQGWFDFTQYRLGLEAGTDMHWSRLVDLPIANLITLFQAIAPGATGEALALAAWPALLLLALLSALALSFRSEGPHAVVAVLFLGAMYTVGINRFSPGAIDHHNVQLVLLAAMAGGLLRREPSRAAFAVAGAAGALALSIGAETMPIVAAACLAVAFVWLALGERARPGIEGFTLAFVATLTATFLATVPPGARMVAYCDAYSAGFYLPGVVGAGALFAAAALGRQQRLPGRFMMLAGVGALAGAAALAFAPQCFANPLAGLDPMLRELWLEKVTEAQSLLDLARSTPEALVSNYLLSLAALALCLYAAWTGNRCRQALTLALLLATALLVASIQVRGAVFGNLFAIFAFVPVVAALRARMHVEPGNWRRALAFCAAVIVLTPTSWAIAGHLAFSEETANAADAPSPTARSCQTAEALAPLRGLAPTTVSSVSNLGASILRFTGHRVLSAPYHRNQGGMLTQLHLAMEPPESARAFMQGAGVGILVYCPGDPETRMLARRAPDGLYAEIGEGRVPTYLERVPSVGDISIFRVR
ncbi:hypothetical protein D5400_00305 [Georhizobium profundi]|uniref:GtrA family protein n=1 Tax=Georhizobium profundi TaxID=2341112 RepID=A0A3S9AYZ1_9HYPH|nr:hypothetical protein [Georhizobium profundi]AZN69914.1 hypothetical protein D5400_00305 [Georhizobium profundi]